MNDRSDSNPRGPIRGRGFPNPESGAPTPPPGPTDRPWRTMPPPRSGVGPEDWPSHISTRPKWSPAQYTFTAIAVLGALVSCVFLFTSLTGSVGTLGLTDDYSSYTHDRFSNRSQDDLPADPRPGTPSITQPATAGSGPESVSMSVLSTPSLATVYIEFDSVGVTPMTAPVPRAGSYLLTISKPGFATLDTVVTVRSGDHPLYRVKLRPDSFDLAEDPEPTRGEASRPRPPQRTARAPSRRDDAPPAEPSAPDRPSSREERVSPQEPDPAPITTPVTTPEPTPSTEPASAEGFGTLEILVRPWGTIYINGELHRSETDMLYSVQLPPGSHEVSVVHPQLGRSQRTVRVSSESKERLIFSLDG